jgi:hypothetical protein
MNGRETNANSETIRRREEGPQAQKREQRRKASEERGGEMRLMFKLFLFLGSVEFLGAVAAAILTVIWLSNW